MVGIFEDDTSVDGNLQGFSPQKETFRMWFGMGYLIGGNDDIDHGIQLRKRTMGIGHLLIVRAGNNGNLHSFLAEFFHEIYYPGNEFEGHAGFEIQ